MLVRINKCPIKITETNPALLNKNRNLDQHDVDNPPMRETTATMITEQVFIGDEETSYDSTFIKQNCITHILNLKGSQIANVFDQSTHREPLCASKLKMLP